MGHRVLLLFVTFAISSFIFIFFASVSPRVRYSSVTEGDETHIKSNEENGTRRKILLWTPLFSGWNFLPLGRRIFHKCKESRCEVTNNRSSIGQVDAVVFHIRTFAMYDLPTVRLSHQKWIFFNMEAPPYSWFPGFQFMSNMFNWTMTYRTDSDVFIHYGTVTQTNKTRHKNQRDLDIVWERKSKLAVWLVSHCNTSGHREHYVNELKKYIDVDVFGECGMAVCLRNQTDSCFQAFAKKYKFILAFENAICEDYVTEKFFKVLKYDIVPVVFGGASYKSISPPKSYINALDYKPYDLALYLRKLASNSSQYLEYLQWKTKGYEIWDGHNSCELCKKTACS